MADCDGSDKSPEYCLPSFEMASIFCEKEIWQQLRDQQDDLLDKAAVKNCPEVSKDRFGNPLNLDDSGRARINYTLLYAL